ncbi:hypothetical protein JCM15765_24140 [Paradesulfitobacterium aromaticivorans]
MYDDKYIEKDSEGKMNLTTYAKEHEEECFLQFITDENGNLHYVKLPGRLADKTFNYADEITEDILKKYGLVNEISTQMLDAIHGLEFGSALKKLMSKRICNYSVRLLRDTTGLDNNTINKMQKSESMTEVNVVSSCLGIHLPFPVSQRMLELARIVFRLDMPPASNQTYVQLLTLRWASDYSEIYDDLKEQGLENLIKCPPI